MKFNCVCLYGHHDALSMISHQMPSIGSHQSSQSILFLRKLAPMRAWMSPRRSGGVYSRKMAQNRMLHSSSSPGCACQVTVPAIAIFSRAIRVYFSVLARDANVFFRLHGFASLYIAFALGKGAEEINFRHYPYISLWRNS